MTATIYFIRHAAHAHLGQLLSGRLPGVGLSDQGVRQAAELAGWLASTPFAAVRSSPVQRARETAEALAPGRIEVAPALDEIEFGDWTGQPFAALDGREDWRRWNAERAAARPPGGESMAEVQARVVAEAASAAAGHPGAAVALVSHCDVIRAAIAFYLGLSLDRLLAFDIDPASVSRVAVGDWGGRVLSLNEMVH